MMSIHNSASKSSICHSFHGAIFTLTVALSSTLAASTVLNAQALARAQSDTVAKACRRCRVDIRHVVTLGESEGDGYVGSTFNVVNNSRYYFVSHRDAPGEIRVFDRHGAFVRLIGRQGSGPGEFRSIKALRVQQDSLFVLDRGSARLTVFSPDLAVARTQPVPTAVHDKGLLPLDGSKILVNGYILSRELAGLPLHVVDAKGVIIRSFGSDGPALPEDVYGLGSVRWMARGEEGSVWTARLNEYILEHFDSLGLRLERLDVAGAEWFGGNGPEGGVEPAQVLDIRLAHDGTLRVLGRMADPRWHSALSRAGGKWANANPTSRFDMIVDVVDPTDGARLASARFDHFPVGFLDADHVFTYRESLENVPLLDVWELVVEPDSLNYDRRRR